MRFSPSTLGWYPEHTEYQNLPADILVVDDALFEALKGVSIEAGPDGMPREYAPPPPSPEQQVKALTYAIQEEMDERARAIGYDDIKTAITYRGDPNPKFAAEADELFAWRSAVWTQAYAFLDQVMQGQAQFPTQEQAIALMPPLGLSSTETSV